MTSLSNKTIFISGGSRGIGLAIAKRAAIDGANIVIAAKTAEPHPKLPGTVFSAANEIEQAGGKALPLVLDIRDADAVNEAVATAAEHFGGIDTVINNASSVRLTPTEHTPPKRYDLMHSVNGRGTFTVTQSCVPYLKKSDNPHILTLSPPLVTDAKWFKDFAPYAISKYTMSLFALAWSAEFKSAGIASNALWPRTAIATAAVTHEIGNESMLKHSRKPEIVADAAHFILTQPAETCTGQFFLDDEVLIAAGTRDLSKYDYEQGAMLQTDFFLEALPGMLPVDFGPGQDAP